MTKRLILRKFTEDDVNSMFDVLRDEETCRFLPFFPMKSEGETRAWLHENYLSKYDDKERFHYAVCEKKKNKSIGYIKVSDDESRDFGYCLSREYWGKGLMTEAASALIRILRDSSISYITATHDVSNIGSGRVMEKIGMDYKYSYEERWMPKDKLVIFRMYQMNFKGHKTYTAYLDKYKRVYEKEM